MSNDLDLAAITGEPVDIKIGNKTYTVSPPTIGDLGKLSAFVKQNRMDSNEKVLRQYLKIAKEEKIDPSQQINVIDSLASKLDMEKVNVLEQLDRPENIQYLLFLCLEKKHKDLTYEKLGDILPVTVMPKLNEIILKLLFGKLEMGENVDKQNPPEENK